MIKKYLEFINYIKENNNIIDELYFTDEYIKDFFYDLIDSNYFIDIVRGTFKHRKIHGNDNFSFYKILIPGKVNKGYEIYIEVTDNINGENLTDSFKDSITRLVDYTNSNYYIELDYYNNKRVKLDDVEFTGGGEGSIIVKNDLQKYYSSIYVYLYDKEETFITDLQVVQYYNWEYDYKDDQDSVYLECDFDKLVEFFLHHKDDYYKYITDEDSIYDYYYSGDYVPNNEDLFRDYLDKDNALSLIKKIVDINGGYKEVISIFEDDKEYSESEVYTYLVNNPRKLEYLDQTDLLDEIITLCGSYLCDAHIAINMSEMKTAFFKELENIVKYKEVKIEDKTIYRIKFDSEWYIDRNYDSNDISNFKHISEVMYEWIHHDDMTFHINPYFSDYGNMDEKEFNREVKSILLSV